MTNSFALDRSNAKLMGVCSGFARYADVDPTLTRVAMILLTFLLGPVAILLYLATGLIAASR